MAQLNLNVTNNLELPEAGSVGIGFNPAKEFIAKDDEGNTWEIGGGGGGRTFVTDTLTTDDDTETQIAAVDSIPAGTSIIEVFITAYGVDAESNVIYGAWRKTLSVTNQSDVVTIHFISSDLDTGIKLDAKSVRFDVNASPGNEVSILVTGIAGQSLNWVSKYEII